MQAWLANNEGKHWSYWPALGHIDIAGHQLISGTNHWTIGELGNTLTIANRGHRIATFTQATDTNAAPSILAAIYNTNATFSIWIDASTAATRAPEVGSVISLTPPVAWLPYATSSNSWPSTVSRNGTNCYYLVCPAPDASRYFRVFFERATTTPPTLDVRALSIDGVPLASTLDGKLGTNDPAFLGAVAHTNRTDNPHAVTPAQIGAVSNTPAGIAAAGGLVTNSISGPGCTYLGTSQAVTLTGATTSYRAEPAGVYTVSVAQAASRYTYALEIVSTNPCTLAAGLNLQGSWTITGTNILAIVPCTGTLWRVYGRGL
jgi:hypothetical protein